MQRNVVHPVRRPLLAVALLATTWLLPGPAAGQDVTASIRQAAADRLWIRDYLRLYDELLTLQAAMGQLAPERADAQLAAAGQELYRQGFHDADVGAVRDALRAAAETFFGHIEEEIAGSTTWPADMPAETYRSFSTRLLAYTRGEFDRALARGADPLVALRAATLLLAFARGYESLPPELDYFVDSRARAAASVPEIELMPVEGAAPTLPAPLEARPPSPNTPLVNAAAGGGVARPAGGGAVVLRSGTVQAEAGLVGAGTTDVVGRSTRLMADGKPDTRIDVRLRAPGMVIDHFEIRNEPSRTGGVVGRAVNRALGLWSTQPGSRRPQIGVVSGGQLLNRANGSISGLAADGVVSLSLFVQDDGQLERTDEPGLLVIYFQGGESARFPIAPTPLRAGGALGGAGAGGAVGGGGRPATPTGGQPGVILISMPPRPPAGGALPGAGGALPGAGGAPPGGGVQPNIPRSIPPPNAGGAPPVTTPTPPVGGAFAGRLQTDRATYTPGQPMSVTFSGFTGTNDWIAVAPAGSAAETYGEWHWTDRRTAGALAFTAPAAGSYELRAFLDWSAGGYTIRARVPFTVAAAGGAPPVVTGGGGAPPTGGGGAPPTGGGGVPPTGGGAPTSRLTSLQAAWIGMDADVVTRGGEVRPDGSPDAHFRVQANFSFWQTVDYITLYSSDTSGNPAGGQVWQTKNGGYWILGVIANGMNLNAGFVPTLGTFNGAVALDLYAGDSGWFNPGQTFTIELGQGAAPPARVVVQAGAAGAPPVVTGGGQPGAGGVDWNTTAQDHRQQIGQRFTYACPPGGSAGRGPWGTDIYTDDSSVCTAAVHAGLLTFAAGGTVTIEMRPNAGSYTGTSRYGVTSSSYGSWDNAFVFVGAGGAPVTPPATFAGSVATDRDTYTEGQSITVTFRGFPATNDWIAIAAAGAAPGSYGEWHWTDGSATSGRPAGTPRRDGTLTFQGLAPGSYEVRAFLDWPNGGNTIRASRAFAVQAAEPPPPTLTSLPADFPSYLQWESEGGWTGTWTRRGTTDLFDAQYQGPSGQRVTTVEELKYAGSRIRGQRLSSSDGAACSLDGAVTSTTTLQGTGACPGINSGWWWRLTVAAAPPPVTGGGGQPGAQAVDWNTTAQDHRQQIGQRFTYPCPPGGAPGRGPWGTDIYTDDSSVCTAAVHAGLITFASGGTVTIEMRPNAGSYTGTSRYGVQTSNYGSWDNAFVFVGAGGAPPTAGGFRGRLQTDAQTYAEGQAITLTFTGFPGTTDWIALTRADLPDDQYGEWHWTDQRTDGTMGFTAPAPGSYELRAYVNWPAAGYTVAARYPVTVQSGGYGYPRDLTVGYGADWIGMDVDGVGAGGSGPPDGAADGHFTLDLDINTTYTVRYVTVYSSDAQGAPAGGQIWTTQSSGYWPLAVYLQGTRLNDGHVASLGSYSGHRHFDLVAANSGYFNPGQYFVVEVDVGLSEPLKRVVQVGGAAGGGGGAGGGGAAGTCGGGDPASGYTVCATQGTPVLTPVLESGRWYVLEVSGTISVWDQNTDRVDAVWCYSVEMCGANGAHWDALRVDGRGLSDYSAAAGGPTPIPYDSSHVYRVYYQGQGRPAQLVVGDAASGSGADNAGAFLVRIYTAQ